VGGLLALSRAFGDAYLKGSDQFEGVSFYASDTYASGFGETLLGGGAGNACTPQPSPGRTSWLCGCLGAVEPE
jgi:hypothetical protein